MLPEKWISMDPGEDFGWALWSGTEFLEHGTDKMWDVGDAIFMVACWDQGLPQLVGGDPLADKFDGISLIVVENWQLYPWKLRSGQLDWDECRTARIIGHIYGICRQTGWTYEQQPALIKERAIAAGAESYFSHPLRENRHANDATMHGVFRIALEANAAWTDLSTASWVVEDDD
jgi:hypothetical protein